MKIKYVYIIYRMNCNLKIKFSVIFKCLWYTRSHLPLCALRWPTSVCRSGIRHVGYLFYYWLVCLSMCSILSVCFSYAVWFLLALYRIYVSVSSSLSDSVCFCFLPRCSLVAFYTLPDICLLLFTAYLMYVVCYKCVITIFRLLVCSLIVSCLPVCYLSKLCWLPFCYLLSICLLFAGYQFYIYYLFYMHLHCVNCLSAFHLFNNYHCYLPFFFLPVYYLSATCRLSIPSY